MPVNEVIYLMNKRYSIWQILAGSSHRSYADQFIDYGVALMGPGDAGPWQPDRYNEKSMRQFVSDIQDGDVLLLRTGASEIKAIGIVASEYQYLPQFDDVNGLDIQHGRRVWWCKFPEPQKTNELSAHSPRFSKVESEDLGDLARKFIHSPPTDWQTRRLPNLPEEEAILETYPPELKELLAQVNDLAGFYKDPHSFGELPKESEIVAHYIVPLLRALGWPVEKIAIEWRNIDVCVFIKLPRTPEHCTYLIEAKRVGAAAGDALGQAVRYAKNLENYCDVVVTDGIRYRMYEAKKNSYDQVAYANLGRLKESSLELFKRMKKP